MHCSYLCLTLARAKTRKEPEPLLQMRDNKHWSSKLEFYGSVPANYSPVNNALEGPLELLFLVVMSDDIMT